MNNFITVKTFTHPHDLAIIRGRLESEGIECFVKDELTVQINPFSSYAIGGVKLQVRESDLEKTVEILKEGGYIKEEDFQPSRIYLLLENVTSKITLIRKLRLEIRLLIIVTIIVSTAVSIFVISTMPSTSEKLTNNGWCVDLITHDASIYYANSTEYIKLHPPGCDENIHFIKGGRVSFPGFNTFEVNGNWKMDGHSLQILNANNFGFIYNGTYELEFSGQELIMKSLKTTIYCHEEHFFIN